MKSNTIFIIISFISFPVPSFASIDEQLVLVCKYEKSFDVKKPTVTKLSGTNVFTVNFIDAEIVIVKKNGLGAQFTGIAETNQIAANTKYKIQNISYEVTFEVNRFNGEFRESVKAGDKELIHTGHCVKQSKPLF